MQTLTRRAYHRQLLATVEHSGRLPACHGNSMPLNSASCCVSAHPFWGRRTAVSAHCPEASISQFPAHGSYEDGTGDNGWRPTASSPPSACRDISSAFGHGTSRSDTAEAVGRQADCPNTLLCCRTFPSNSGLQGHGGLEENGSGP